MKDRIQKLINDQLRPIGDIIDSLDGYPSIRNIHMFREKETQNRELLASLIEILIDEYETLKSVGNPLIRDKYNFFIDGKEDTLALIEKTISLSWPKIVKRLEV